MPSEYQIGSSTESSGSYARCAWLRMICSHCVTPASALKSADAFSLVFFFLSGTPTSVSPKRCTSYDHFQKFSIAGAACGSGHLGKFSLSSSNPHPDFLWRFTAILHNESPILLLRPGAAHIPPLLPACLIQKAEQPEKGPHKKKKEKKSPYFLPATLGECGPAGNSTVEFADKLNRAHGEFQPTKNQVDGSCYWVEAM